MMNDKEKAIRITKTFLEKNEIYKDYIVDSSNILERESLWYIPFKELNPDSNNFLVGAYNGIIVDKSSSDFLQPGSALSLDEWIYGFEIGIRGERYDLIIEKVIDFQKTLDILSKIGLSYVEIEIENGTEWKIPKNFKQKEIKSRLDKLPCKFKNQSFTYSINEFKKIRSERIFEYKLVTTENTDSSILGELLN
ncbi:hypothetical protein [Flavobacterium haoranii]|uniref:Immunity protein 35 n=2 Tax=Flavobacterium haoranii TaxID=683124 RepID=A0A1M6H4M5_9FLAO|nr:hypothetical protein [Flavobacterium haoranii]SHJ17125.1 hypothetical protein SAMN05444337_1428 [Flavobacterium haoranii]